jgi:hypothetical protein
MRLVANGGFGTLRQGLIVVGLLALSAVGASAQLVFDGNLLYLNNASGTLAGQFVGVAGVGAPTCPGGTTAASIGTVTYTHNAYLDPLLPNAPYKVNIVPNFQPSAGSPAYGSAVVVPADGFFKQACYRGAIGPNAGDDWTQGWTYYDSTGANRQDLHLATMPNPRPLATYDNITILGKKYFSPDSNYLVRGQLRVKSQGSLTVAPGVVIFENTATLGTIVVERGGQIHAIGNACEPIIITSDQTPGSQTRGSCGGIYLLGRAKTNNTNSCAGDSSAAEGGAIGYYGGNDDNDGSGELRYVRVEYAGKEITPNNELNSFTFCGVGKNTHADYCQAFFGADDGFEWFGGSMDETHLIAIDGTDDGYDWQWGTRNRAQFVIVRTSPKFAPSGTQNGDKGIEADNTEPPASFFDGTCSGRSLTQIANMTMIGDRRFDDGSVFPGPSSGVNWRRGTGGTLLNSIIYNYKTAALKIDDDATFENHCANLPAAPAVYCPISTSVAPITEGNVFVARSQPNPFRSQVSLSFTLPKAGPVSVEIYSADGRHVTTLAKGEMPAGQHSLSWAVDKSTPSGLYFYRVLAGEESSTGKITHVD